MRMILNRKAAAALALSLSLGLGACGGMPENRSLNSTKQPVVERTSYTLDVNTNAGGLPINEQQRLAGWFEAMDLRYGDRISVEDPTANPAVSEAVGALAGRYGLLLADTSPVTAGYVAPGQARIVVSRTTAHVPGCPDWSVKSDMNYTNGVYPNYGCANNSNLAAMVANPQDLVQGQTGTGETVVMSSTKAIRTFRDAVPTGATGLGDVSTTEGE
ncbi:MAG: CpaD family pilus assembly protein [Qipengyuania sp.]